MKTAILMRHAEAGRHPDDYERELTDVGRDEARRAATRIAVCAHRIDWAITSAATRARTTAGLVLGHLGSPATLSAREALYESGTEVYLEALRSAPDEADCVLIVGHNPTISTLAQRLLGQPVSLGTADWVAVEHTADDWKRLGRRS